MVEGRTQDAQEDVPKHEHQASCGEARKECHERSGESQCSGTQEDEDVPEVDRSVEVEINSSDDLIARNLRGKQVKAAVEGRWGGRNQKGSSDREEAKIGG